MILGCWGLGKVIDSTKSIVAVTCFQMIFNIIMFNGKMTNGIEGSAKLMILGITIVLRIIIMNFWKKKERKKERTTTNNDYN